MNILQMKKHYFPIKAKWQNKQSLHILLWEKISKTRKTIEDQGRKQVRALKVSERAEQQELKSIESIFSND